MTVLEVKLGMIRRWRGRGFSLMVPMPALQVHDGPTFNPRYQKKGGCGKMGITDHSS